MADFEEATNDGEQEEEEEEEEEQASGGEAADRVDHVALTAEAEAGGGPAAPGAFAAERDAVAAAVGAYVGARYGAECKCGAVYESDDASELAVVISGESVNLRNFWSAHYFEDGNVQLQTSKTCGEATVAAASPADLGAAVAAFVEAAETDLQNGLQEMYDNMCAETFKAMRRVMPITRTKMKWNIHEISLNKNLRK
ncbi:hypothetical protein JL722_11538 [Aureococcus anophagefferens]|nr:hypothetical protein JL722_11538 [Aureococcus anophagefferens]